jgi:REP element-mobilizing transposase RayT
MFPTASGGRQPPEVLPCSPRKFSPVVDQRPLARDSSMSFDRYWLLTWTSYGSWLPGDPRGNVTSVKDGPGPRHRNNTPGTPTDGDMPGLRGWAEQHMKGPPVHLDMAQAEQVLAQFHETVAHRQWLLIAVSIMRTHIHVEVGVPGDPDPEVILRDLKAYASRRLNTQWTAPASGTWWTKSGSKRKLKDEAAILTAARYIRDQPSPLVIWIHPSFAPELANPA